MPPRRQRKAWETGHKDSEGNWDPAGKIEPPLSSQGDGSQVPPARDRDGRFEDPDMAVYPWQVVPKEAVRRVAASWIGLRAKGAASMKRTAGEVRFIKDRGGDKNEWGWGSPGPSERALSPEFEFKPANLKPLATALRASLAALGHAMSAYQTFTKIKSARVSPDGALGGKGYIAKIADMRRQYMNVVEALSAITDTIYDEVNASHWNPAIQEQSPREREQVQEIMQDADEIREDPEGWAEDEEEEMSAGGRKQAKFKRFARLQRRQRPEYVTDIDQMRIRRVAAAHAERAAAPKGPWPTMTLAEFLGDQT